MSATGTTVYCDYLQWFLGNPSSSPKMYENCLSLFSNRAIPNAYEIDALICFFTSLKSPIFRRHLREN